MKKLVAVAFTAAVAVSALASDVLFWQVDGVSDTSIGTFDAVNIYVLPGDGTDPVRIGGDEWSTTQTAGSAEPLSGMTLPSRDLSLYGEGARFFAELSLYGESEAEDTVVGRTGELSYGDLKPYFTSYAGGSAIPTQGVWNPSSSFSAVPEPTGGLLVLLGAAALALRRRRA